MHHAAPSHAPARRPASLPMAHQVQAHTGQRPAASVYGAPAHPTRHTRGARQLLVALAAAARWTRHRLAGRGAGALCHSGLRTMDTNIQAGGRGRTASQHKQSCVSLLLGCCQHRSPSNAGQPAALMLAARALVSSHVRHHCAALWLTTAVPGHAPCMRDCGTSGHGLIMTLFICLLSNPSFPVQVLNSSAAAWALL